MSMSKRASASDDSLTPSKRGRTAPAEQWRSSSIYQHAGENLSDSNDNNDHLIPPERDANHAEVISENSETPARKTYMEAVKEALHANPIGLQTREVISWLRTNRPEVFSVGEEEQVQASLRVALSRQANQKNPSIVKYKDAEPGVRGYIWKLNRTADETGNTTDGMLMPSSTQSVIADTRAASTSHTRDREAVTGQNHRTASNGLRSSSTDGDAASRSHTFGTLPISDQSAEEEGLGRDTIVVATDTSARSTPNAIFGKADSLSTQRLDIREQDHPNMHQPSQTTADVRIGNDPTPLRQQSAPRIPEDSDVPADDMSPEDRIALEFGKRVVAIQKMNGKRRDLKEELESQQRRLPDIAILTDDAEAKQDAVQDLTLKLAEACRTADEASATLRDATQLATSIAAKAHELEDLDNEIDQRRLALDIG